MINLAINGFGRIGRLALRVALNYPHEIRVVAINTSGKMDVAGWAHLFQYDTAYRKYKKEVKWQTSADKYESKIGDLMIGDQLIAVLAQRDPEKLPWERYDVDIAVESTGVFRDRQSANKHLKAGAKKVIISAPAKSEDIPTYLVGVNLLDYKGEKIIDAGSCTTNCAAPVLKTIWKNFGIKKAFLTTVHAYTGDQRLQDGSHHDLRRARAAAQNIVPTSTGATKAVVKAIPELGGKLDGLSIRVPVLVGSLLDLSILLEKKTGLSEIKQTFMETANSELKGILEAVNEPLVSADIIGNSHSAIIDLERTQLINADFLKIIAWYDNEWAPSNRLIETAIYIGKK